MTTFKKFSGINNVKPTARLANDELSEALNVDVGVDGEIARRAGYALLAAGTSHSVHETMGGKTLAVIDGGLKNVTDDVLLQAGVGTARVWYCDLPTGQTLYSNGAYQGVVAANGTSAHALGIDYPHAIGAGAAVAGSLFAGKYRYALSMVRAIDGRESGLIYSAPFDLADGETLQLTGLEIRAGHTTNVYLTTANGGDFYLAGSTTTADFTFDGFATDLTRPAYTDLLSPPPLGILPAFWRGRVLLAAGNLLLASKTHMWHLFNMRRDFKQFEDQITLVMPLTDGIYIGTTKRLYWLSGTEWDKLTMNSATEGLVVLGSGVAAPGEQLKRGESNGQPIHGSDGAMVCICDGRIVAGFNNGDISRMTEGVYHRHDLVEVSAAFREVRGISQYVAAATS